MPEMLFGSSFEFDCELFSLNRIFRVDQWMIGLKVMTRYLSPAVILRGAFLISFVTTPNFFVSAPRHSALGTGSASYYRPFAALCLGVFLLMFVWVFTLVALICSSTSCKPSWKHFCSTRYPVTDGWKLQVNCDVCIEFCITAFSAAWFVCRGVQSLNFLSWWLWQKLDSSPE